ncbi:MAG: NUDIX domain-containing protein [Candidatus Paceibacterota bacterium]|jgi:8-oxo-dGTP diphosphatase
MDLKLQVGVKILLKNKDGKYLVVRRSKDKYPEAGPQWEVVGGRIDPGTTLIENLKREVLEETGLTIQGEVKLITAQDILKTQKHIVRLTYTGHADGEVKLSGEHTDFKWLSLAEILKLEPLDSYTKKVIENFDF